MVSLLAVLTSKMWERAESISGKKAAYFSTICASKHPVKNLFKSIIKYITVVMRAKAQPKKSGQEGRQPGKFTKSYKKLHSWK